jgi:hypothetical protein
VINRPNNHHNRLVRVFDMSYLSAVTMVLDQGDLKLSIARPDDFTTASGPPGHNLNLKGSLTKV